MSPKRRTAPFNPDNTMVPQVFVDEGNEVLCMYYGSVNDALNGALCADVLGFGWRLDAYDGPVSDTEEQREWRLVVWRFLRSDAVISRRDVPTASQEK